MVLQSSVQDDTSALSIRYFVFYQLKDENGVSGQGRLELLRNKPITDSSDIVAIEEDIVKNDPNAHTAMVQFWQRFEEC